jgi:predicted Zn-dependent protease
VTFQFAWRAAAAVSLAACLWPQAVRADSSYEQRVWETQIGQQRYLSYEQRGEIIPQQASLYRTLDPIADAIASVANPQYFTPFHFLLLNESTPNALAAPGGNVYVTAALLSFLKNRDELAGVICHEVNHDIHHDMFAVYQATQGGRVPQDPNAIAYERQSETNADRAGAYTCAKAGFNPWGMVWNLRLHGQTPNAQQGGPNSDHPSDGQRAENLIALFQSDPATFGRFRDDVAAAKPLDVPQMQVSQQYGYRPYPQYPQGQYPQPQYQQYPPQYQQYPQPQYPQPQYQQNPQQQGPYPPPPLPPCYPRC